MVTLLLCKLLTVLKAVLWVRVVHLVDVETGNPTSPEFNIFRGRLIEKFGICLQLLLDVADLELSLLSSRTWRLKKLWGDIDICPQLTRFNARVHRLSVFVRKLFCKLKPYVAHRFPNSRTLTLVHEGNIRTGRSLSLGRLLACLFCKLLVSLLYGISTHLRGKMKVRVYTLFNRGRFEFMRNWILALLAWCLTLCVDSTQLLLVADSEI